MSKCFVLWHDSADQNHLNWMYLIGIIFNRINIKKEYIQLELLKCEDVLTSQLSCGFWLSSGYRSSLNDCQIPWKVHRITCNLLNSGIVDIADWNGAYSVVLDFLESFLNRPKWREPPKLRATKLIGTQVGLQDGYVQCRLVVEKNNIDIPLI